MKLSTADKRKWYTIKKEVSKRPLLIHTLSLSKDEIKSLYSEEFPSKVSIDRLDEALLSDRISKTERLSSVLEQVAGPRGSAKLANKLGTNPMTIKYIIDKKYKRPPSHDLISRIEILLSYLSNFDVSAENKEDEKAFIDNWVNDIQGKLSTATGQIDELKRYLTQVKHRDKKKNKPTTFNNWDSFIIDRLKYTLSTVAKDLGDIQCDIDTMVDEMIVK